MIRAVDNDGNSVVIWSAEKGKAYFCPICHQPLIQKRGEQRSYHFAHVGIRSGGTFCTDHWNYDKTDWHIDWQKRFPDDCCEKIISVGTKKHIADVQINNLVIEFQHSPITLSEFRDRNDFYSTAGFKVVWIFDVSEEWESEKIVNDGYPANKYTWSYPRKLFREMEFKQENASLYFQFSDETDEDALVLERVTGGYNRFTQFYTDLNHALSIESFVKYISTEEKKVIPQKENKPEIPETVKGGSTIYELWKPKYSGMVVQNLVTGKEMVINGKDGEMYRQDHNPNKKIIGKYSNVGSDNRYHYSDYYPVWDEDKAVWVLKKAFISQEYLENEKIDTEISKQKIEGERLDYLLFTTPGNVFFCHFDKKYYYFQFVDNTRDRYNVYEFNPEDGEIANCHSNAFVYKMRDKKVWTPYSV